MEFSATSFARAAFYDFLEKRGNGWGIVLRQPIYETDRVDSLTPPTSACCAATLEILRRLEAFGNDGKPLRGRKTLPDNRLVRRRLVPTHQRRAVGELQHHHPVACRRTLQRLRIVRDDNWLDGVTGHSRPGGFAVLHEQFGVRDTGVDDEIGRHGRQPITNQLTDQFECASPTMPLMKSETPTTMRNGVRR